MKALGKIVGLVVLGLLLLIVALGFALTNLLDPNDYKDEIRQLARDKAGLELNIDGDIGWSLFPWLGLELHDTTLAAAQTPDQPLASLRMLGFSVRVMPLLRREIQMSDIRVNGLDLNLVRDAKGRGNWEGIGQRPTGEAKPDTPPTGEPASEPRRPLALDIDSLTVSDARVSYQDARSGQSLTVDGIELSTGAIREGAPIPLKLSAFFGTNQPVLRASSVLNGALRFDTELKRYQLEGLLLSGEVSGEPLKGKTLTYNLQGELLVDLAAQLAELNSLKVSVNQLRGLGQLAARDLTGEPKVSGNLSIAPFDLTALLRELGQELPPMADPKALQRVELVTRLTGSSKALALDELKLQVDDTSLSGRIAIDNFETQALRVNLKGDRLDLDRYLPPPSEKEQAQKASRSQAGDKAALAGAGTSPLPDKPTQHAWKDEPALPLEPLRTLDSRLNLTLNQLTINQLPLDEFTLKARSAGGLLQLEELRGRLFGGAVESNARLDVRPAVPQISVQKRLTDVPLEPLLNAQNQEVVIKGLLTLNTSLHTQGNSQKVWVDNLNGSLSFAVNNGVLVDANLEQQLCRAIATLNRKPLAGEPRGRDTPFRQLTGTLGIQNGVASNRDLLVSIPGLTVKGSGDIDLRVLGMDYRIATIIEGDKSDMPDPACQVNQRYVGLEWPLRCRGPLELGARACRVDEQGLGKVAGKLAGEKLNEKIEEKLGDKVSPELKDALKGLFGR